MRAALVEGAAKEGEGARRRDSMTKLWLCCVIYEPFRHTHIYSDNRVHVAHCKIINIQIIRSQPGGRTREYYCRIWWHHHIQGGWPQRNLATIRNSARIFRTKKEGYIIGCEIQAAPCAWYALCVRACVCSDCRHIIIIIIIMEFLLGDFIVLQQSPCRRR